MASAESNKDVIRRYFQRLDEDAVSAIEEFVAQDFLDRTPGRGLPPDREGLKESARRFLAAVPDGFHRIEQLIAEDDKVVAFVRGYGTQVGELLGVRPTAKMITTAGIVIFRLGEGKIVERWSVVDNHGLLRELTEGGRSPAVPSPHDAG
jgi:predicted ester cyclase